MYETTMYFMKWQILHSTLVCELTHLTH